MNKFLLLILAHMIGDYPLQTDWIFKVRYSKRFGILAHTIIHTICVIILLFPYLYNIKTWVAIAGIFITHLIIDFIKKNNIWTFFLDQALHLGVILAASLVMLKAAPFPLPEWLASIWFDDSLIMLLIGFFAASFAGTIFIFFLKVTWRSGYSTQRGLSLFEKNTGVLERGLVYLLLMLGWFANPIYNIFIIIPPAVRMFFLKRLRGDTDHYQNVYFADIVTGFIYTIFIAGVTVFCIEHLIPSITSTA